MNCNVGVGIMSEYAEEMHIGEERRNASDTIRGFLFQDHLAIELILDANDNDNIYVEWVEDIFVENDDNISIYQVKYYPKSHINMNKIYQNLFYQYLKYELFKKESEEKEVKTYCLYHSQRCTDVSVDDVKNICIKKENKINEIDKEYIKAKLMSCDDIDKRQNLLFEEIASTSLFSEFKFEKKEKQSIVDIRNNLKEKLFKTDKVNKSMLKMKNEEDIKDILLSVALEYIHESYYKKPEDYKLRRMTKASFFDYINKIVGVDERQCIEIIKFIVLGYIDEVFGEIYHEITKAEVIDAYRNIYMTTKEFFKEKLNNKETRFKFLNTISTDRYEHLNRGIYMDYSAEEELEKFMEYKDKIRQFLLNVWKILFDVKCVNFGAYFKDNEYECIFFEYPDEKAKPVIIVSPGNGEPKRDADKTFDRVIRMKIKPRKWYFRHSARGKYVYSYKKKYEYSYKINKIRKNELNGKFNYNDFDIEDSFVMECLNCIKYDIDQIENRDPNYKCIFELDCPNKEEV